MSAVIQQMLADREQSERAHEAGLRREIKRRIIDEVKNKFVLSFNRQSRFYRARHSTKLPALPLETQAVCEAAELAQDQGWDADRAWNFSDTRKKAIEAAKAELERKL